MELKFKVTKEMVLKDFLKEVGVSRTLGRKIKLYGKVYLNDIEVKNHVLVRVGDVIKIYLPPTINANIKIINKPVDVLYEDEIIIIVNKEANLSIQPSSKHQDDNLVSRVLAYFFKNNIQANCHILTRLDYPVSGIVIIAKNAYVHNMLSKTQISKEYLCKTSEPLPENSGNIHLPITRDFTSKIKRKVDISGKEATTLYRLINEDDLGYTYLIKILTGRTHQIRVHLSHLGSPIIGDELYFGNKYPRLLLHSYRVKFVHPIKMEDIVIECPSLDF
ncbi:MAG: RluA family pseudouridine synthase [Bacilli bacterium]|nr:RluA family pseudouridine synthase [Bacilli bacterium]